MLYYSHHDAAPAAEDGQMSDPRDEADDLIAEDTARRNAFLCESAEDDGYDEDMRPERPSVEEWCSANADVWR